MKNRNLRNRGSAYLMALGVLAVLVVIGIAMSRMTTSGRWSTIFSSNEKRAEECAESAANLTFKVVKDNMNDYSAFWKLFKDPDKLLKSWFMYFRLPAPVAGAYVDPVSFENAKENGVDVQLDLFNSTIFKPLYEKGIVYMYDTVSPDPEAPLAPLKGMFEALGGRVRITCTARIKNAFAILADNPDYVVGGVEVPLRKVTGFLGNLYDKIKIGAADVISGDDDTSDPTGEQDSSSSGFPNVDIAKMLPNDPLLEAPDISKMTITVQGVPVPVGAILQVPLDKIFKKIQTQLGLTPQKIAKKVFGSALQFEIDFEGINKRIEEAIQNCLPKFLQAFAGNASFDVTVEKQGFFEVVTEVEYTPQYPNGPTIKKKLIMHREFRVADIQPIASDYTFFVANSKLLYEKSLENFDSWAGNDQIKWNEGMGTIVIHNMPSIKEIWDSIKNIFSLDIKELAKNLKLPGLVRVNGTKEMLLKLTMFEKFPVGADALDVFKKMEIVALLTPHKDGKTACADDHPSGGDRHSIIPGLKSVLYNFWDKGKPFDWGYFGGGEPGAIGTYWLPIPPMFARTLLFGNFHLEFPLSMRVEGYLKKVYTHIRLLLVKIYIPPIPIIGFLGMDIPIPWFWAKAHKEPYGFCQWPPYKNEDEGKTAWDPSKRGNLPANVYSPTQYLKKASYFYASSYDFTKDIDNRSIMYNGKKTFICDGISFVNDNLWLDKPMHVMGRGIIVAAANVHISADITRENQDANGNNTLFSIVARNGAIVNHYGKHTVYACVFGDKGILNPIGAKLTIHGNLVVNRFKRKDCQGDLDVYYDSNHCRSSLLSMIRPVAKWDPTRYYVTLSAQTALFQFVKQ